jgi:hypothetical protein
VAFGAERAENSVVLGGLIVIVVVVFASGVR